MERLDKALANYANVSRSEARSLIKSGRVLVDEIKALSPEQKLQGGETVSVNGEIIDLDKHVYYMMNKPQGVVSATRDEGCKTVLDLLPREFRRKGLFPAGRLDKDTEGFVLLTDDGEFAHRILSPKSHVPKKYFARLDGKIPADLPGLFALGVDLGGGDVCSPAELKILGEDGGAEVELIIYEGMYHQVKRMFLKFSLTVTYLKRVQIGGLSLDVNLPPGGVRKILHKELERIW